MSRLKFQFRIGDFEFNLRELAGSTKELSAQLRLFMR